MANTPKHITLAIQDVEIAEKNLRQAKQKLASFYDTEWKKHSPFVPGTVIRHYREPRLGRISRLCFIDRTGKVRKKPIVFYTIFRKDETWGTMENAVTTLDDWEIFDV